MSLADEIEVYDARRYLAVVSVLDYQGSASINDLDFYSHTTSSLEPEVRALEEMGLLEEFEEEGEIRYQPAEEYEEDFEEIGEIVQIENNGLWKNVNTSDLNEDRTEVLGWIT